MNFNNEKLLLKEINIFNFKSFKGHHSINRIHQRTSVIIGPNGSGKSNVIDSMLFVLGFKAKKMRHGNLGDLIYNGEAEAFVELGFNLFTIRRTLKKSAKTVSYYFLNGKETKVDDVIQFLKSHGIDLDNNRFLILQGEIESISLMNPMQLLEYIEDCIGTSQYKGQIDAMEETARQLTGELEIQETNYRFMEKDYNYKKEKKEEVGLVLRKKKESLKMKREIVEMKKTIAWKKKDRKEKEKEEKEEELKDIVERNSGTAEIIRQLQDQKTQQEKEYQKTEAKALALRKENSRIEKIIKQKTEMKKRQEAEAKEIKKKMEEEAAAEREYNKNKSKYQEGIQEKSTELEKLKLRKKKIKEEMDVPEYNEREQQLRILEKQLVEQLKNKKENQSKVYHESLITKLQELYITTHDGVEPEVPEWNVDTINSVRDNTTTNLKNEHLAVTNLIKDIQLTEVELNKRKSKAEESKYQEFRLKREQDVINCLKMDGVYGYLKTLGLIDPGYEQAVFAACKSMGSIVVVSTKVAEDCIKIINKNKLPRTTFLILDKLKFENFVGDGLLYKHIKTDKQFEVCFNFALKDTLVVENMEQARELSFGRVRKRVVTLKGELLEKSGVMSKTKNVSSRSFHEVETAYKNMLSILETRKGKRDALEQLVSLANKTLHHYKNNESKIKEQESCCLESLKDKITQIREQRMSPQLMELEGELSLINTKMGILMDEKTQLERKLNTVPTRSIFQEREQIVITETLINNDEIELEYTRRKQELSHLLEEITKVKKETKEEYQREVELRSGLDIIQETIKESEGIIGHCVSKTEAIEKEFQQISFLIQEKEELCCSCYDSKDEAELKSMSTEMVNKLNKLEGDFIKDMEDLQSYKQIIKDYSTSEAEYNKATESYNAVVLRLTNSKTRVEELKNERHTTFMDGFTAINRNLKEIFILLTNGGNAEIELINILNPFSEGVVLSIMPPKKAWKQVTNLSGGEKTLSSLSLIFSLHRFRPSPFYIMDEIDAALDYRNVGIISQFISKTDTQFIIISLRNDMFEKSDLLIGVYKFKDASQTVILDVRA